MANDLHSVPPHLRLQSLPAGLQALGSERFGTKNQAHSVLSVAGLYDLGFE
jgi:hypothetical protein